MSKKLTTISLSGKAYATVPVRIKEFREVCPNGNIESEPKYLENGFVEFKTSIVKDGNTPNIGRGTGHARGLLYDSKGVEIPKAFEKLETISIGRALAVLGFMSSGEVASFEEMEDFLSTKETIRQEKILEVKEKVETIKDLAELREYFKTIKGLGIEAETLVTDRADQLKEIEGTKPKAKTK